MTEQPLAPTDSELLMAIHDMLLVLHIDAQRNYDMLYAIATGQSEAAIDGLVDLHRQGLRFAPDPFFDGEPEEGPTSTFDENDEPSVQDYVLMGDGQVIDLTADYDNDKDDDS
jgi:hypothetical protein